MSGRRLLATAALVLAMAAVAGCGDDGKQDAASVRTTDAVVRAHGDDARLKYGRSLFNEFCAGCHTLADAGARGQRYDLDGTLLAGPQVWTTVREGGPGMPAWKGALSEREYEAVGQYLLVVARQGEDERLWVKQIVRRTEGGKPAWSRIERLVAREAGAGVSNG